MRLFAITAILTAWGFPAEAQTALASGAPEITVPAGSKVALRLTRPLDSLTAQPGDTVHAKVAFPVAVGDTVAIPPETYVDGTIDKVTRRGRHAGFRFHFTQIIFTTGYTVAVPGAADTRAALHKIDALAAANVGGASPMASSLTGPQTPSLSQTQPSFAGPNMGAIIGLTVGAAVAGAVAIVALAHRGNGLRLDVGSTVDMTLESAVSLDAAKVAAAVATPGLPQ
jgi:hypothetical protein